MSKSSFYFGAFLVFSTRDLEEDECSPDYRLKDASRLLALLFELPIDAPKLTLFDILEFSYSEMVI